MSARHPLIPPPGNAVRPVFFLLAGFFGVMLIGYPIFMYVMGLSTAGIVGVTLLIVAVAAGILGFTLYLARAYEQNASSLDSGEIWADWTVPEPQHRRFVESETHGTRRKALAYAVGGVLLGLGLGALEQDRLLAGIIIGAFLLAALVIFFLGGPPRGAYRDDARHVRIGPRGVRVMGRYLAFDAPLTRLRGVELEPSDPPALRFSIKAGRRTDDVRVPIAPGHLDDAEALVDRLRRHHDLRA